MECKSRIVGYDELRKTITVSVPSMDGIEKYLNTDIRLNVKTWREPRSRTANNYFFVLVEKLANALRYSKPYIHNLMLRKYGQLQQIDGKPVWVVLPESEEVAKRVDEDETLHVRPTDEVKEGKDGKMYRTYLLLKGSHELNSKEFSILLDGIISDCHEANIQTATPQEIQMMKERWGIEIDGAKD